MSTRTLQILNVLGFVLVITMNTLANTLPINGYTTGELSDRFPNLFVPAGFTFSIWGLIYLLLLAFVIYQARSWWKPEAKVDFVQTIGPWFFISCLANASWILAWHYLLTPLSLVIMLLILSSLVIIYRRLRIGEPVTSSAERWLVHVPFSIYLGWITVATIANITTVLVDQGWAGGSIGEASWARIMVAAAALIGLYFLWKKRDVPYALVIIWALYGIAAIRYNNWLLLVIYVGIILLSIGVIWRIRSWWKLAGLRNRA